MKQSTKASTVRLRSGIKSGICLSERVKIFKALCYNTAISGLEPEILSTTDIRRIDMQITQLVRKLLRREGTKEENGERRILTNADVRTKVG